MAKYRNKKVTIDNIEFDSKLESERYCELKLLQKAGLINNIKMQVPFELQPAFSKNKKKYRAIIYIADFVYYDEHLKKVIVEDVKGYKTKEYQIKKKLFEYKYPDFEILEIKKESKDEWRNFKY